MFSVEYMLVPQNWCDLCSTMIATAKFVDDKNCAAFIYKELSLMFMPPKDKLGEWSNISVSHCSQL